MRRVGLVVLMGATAGVLAQVPDVQVKAELVPTYQSEIEGHTTLRWYTPFGQHSTVAFQFGLEPGFRAYLSQKLQRIPGDGDTSPFEESYVEDIDNWRAGKQYLPFGLQTVLRESVLAIRSDTYLLFRYFPMSIAACDGGSGRPRGLVGHVGTRLGASFAFGTNFGISGTSLTQARDPEDSPGRGGGYKRAFGLDYFYREGIASLHGEYVWLLDDHDGGPNRDVLALTLTLAPDSGRSLDLGYSAASRPALEQYWAKWRYQVTSNSWVEPYVRMRGTQVHDAGVTIRVRL